MEQAEDARIFAEAKASYEITTGKMIESSLEGNSLHVLDERGESGFQTAGGKFAAASDETLAQLAGSVNNRVRPALLSWGNVKKAQQSKDYDKALRQTYQSYMQADSMSKARQLAKQRNMSAMVDYTQSVIDFWDEGEQGQVEDAFRALVVNDVMMTDPEGAEEMIDDQTWHTGIEDTLRSSVGSAKTGLRVQRDRERKVAQAATQGQWVAASIAAGLGDMERFEELGGYGGLVLAAESGALDPAAAKGVEVMMTDPDRILSPSVRSAAQSLEAEVANGQISHAEAERQILRSMEGMPNKVANPILKRMSQTHDKRVGVIKSRMYGTIRSISQAGLPGPSRARSLFTEAKGGLEEQADVAKNLAIQTIATEEAYQLLETAIREEQPLDEIFFIDQAISIADATYRKYGDMTLEQIGRATGMDISETGVVLPGLEEEWPNMDEEDRAAAYKWHADPRLQNSYINIVKEYMKGKGKPAPKPEEDEFNLLGLDLAEMPIQGR